MSTLVESWISWFVASIFGLGRADDLSILLAWPQRILFCVFYVGWLDGLLGVIGMINLLVMKWIIPEKFPA
jgi:hypothetical protein